MTTMTRTNLLEIELEALFQVSHILSKSLNLHKTLLGVIEALHDTVGMHRGMVTLLDDQSGELLISAMHNEDKQRTETVRYRPGEGIVGAILSGGENIVVPRLADDSRFLDRLGIYDSDMRLSVCRSVLVQISGLSVSWPPNRKRKMKTCWMSRPALWKWWPT